MAVQDISSEFLSAEVDHKVLFITMHKEMHIGWLCACKLYILPSFPLDVKLCVRGGGYPLVFCPAFRSVACYTGEVGDIQSEEMSYGRLKTRIHVHGVIICFI